jgi:hypothetical protein
MLREGDYVFFGAEASPTVFNAMGQLRLHLAHECGLIKTGDISKWAFTWVLDFPLFEWDPEAGRLMAAHHPFTRPKKSDEAKLLSGDPKQLREVQAEAYDLALNGFEIAGGSLRIFDPKIQAAMFQAIGFSKDEAEKQFGFFHGSPPIRHPTSRRNRFWHRPRCNAHGRRRFDPRCHRIPQNSPSKLPDERHSFDRKSGSARRSALTGCQNSRLISLFYRCDGPIQKTIRERSSGISRSPSAAE